MKIGAIDGTLTFADGAIGRGMTRAQFLASGIGRRSTPGLVNEPWRHYAIDPESGAAGTVLFDGDRLDRVVFALAIPGDAESSGTEAHELARKERHDAWLLGALGRPPYEYDWGRVASEFDARAVASEIIVVYGS